MPVHATTVPDYCGVLVRSKLMPEPEVSHFYRRWKTDGGDDADVDGFRKQLVQKRCLTEYQAALIQRGHSDGFFVNGYTILERLGRGATAGVYKAVHTSGQLVALKVLPSSKAKNPNTLNRFQREGRLLTMLDHPNVVRAFQIGQAGSLNYIVMEHLDGETLDEVLIRRKKLPPPEAVRLIHQSLSGLQHLHEKRMIHRDLKPSNLMVIHPDGGRRSSDSTLDLTVKILDIGIGRELFDERARDNKDMELTIEGAILGTPDYLSPEQARDPRQADIRSDIYSLGCVLFHLIGGRPPYSDPTVMGQMVRHATERLVPLAKLATSIPPGLQIVLDRMTAKKREVRYQTPQAAAEALHPFLPADSIPVSASAVLPAYQAWLAAETGNEILNAISDAASDLPEPASQIDPSSEINVELAGQSASPSPYVLSRRDMLMMGIGAGGVLTAIGVGYLLAKVARPTTEAVE